MTENIRDIFDQNIKLLGDMDKAVFYFREQQYDIALSIVADSLDHIKFVLEGIVTNREYFNLAATDALLEMLTGILEAKKNKDFILLADLLELQLINFLVGVQELIIGKEEILFNEDNYKENIELLLKQGICFPEKTRDPINTAELLENGYRIEFTSCGQMTMAAENDGAKFYFHTNSKVREEAFILAKNWYQPDKKRYILYGLGMGYHIKELMTLAKEAELVVYEADLNVVQLACAFAEIRELLQQEKLWIIYDPELQLLKERVEAITSEEIFLVHYPSFLNVRNSEGKEVLKTAFPWYDLIET